MRTPASISISRGLVVAWIVICWPLAARAQKPHNFNRDIRPILSNNCFKCHGFDEKNRQADLRLDTLAGATAELPSGGKAIVPGDLSASALVARITSDNPDERMPPPSSGKTLTPEQIELLKQWVAAGAEYKAHWSFTPPERKDPPAVQQADWARNPIDNFVLAKLEEEGLKPAPQADRYTLARRLSLDLTGLPPTPAEVDAFVADASPDAYEKLVDRLLASPRYGEHMGRYWLDQARYGDTHGLHLDNERSMWPYRDWVINAFNRNQPFDQFTIEQIAGDLLPNATQDQKVATGFSRCNVSTSEGGSIDDEVLVRYAVDRVETTSTVFLGLTLGCAVCHDHKFDPVTQKEFYQLFAFFNGVAEKAMDGNALLPPPVMKVPSGDQVAQKQTLEQQLAAAQHNIDEALAKVEYSEPVGASAVPAGPHEYVWFDDALPAGAKPQQTGHEWRFVSQLDRPVYSGEKATVRKAAGLAQHFFLEANPGLRIGEGDRLFCYVYIDPADPPKTIMLQFNDGQWEHRAFWGEDLVPFGASGSPARLPMGGLPVQGQWVRLEVEAAKVGFKPGDVLQGWAFTQHDGTVYWDKAGIVTRTPQAGQLYDSLAAWETAERAQKTSVLPKDVRDAVVVDAAARNADQARLVRNYFLANLYAGSRAVIGPLQDQLAAAKKQIEDAENAVASTLVMADMEQARETFLLIRGAYDKRGDKVEAGVPGVLHPLPDGVPRNRMALARWLVDPKNPLTARVTINRVWQQYFGIGLVKTAEDFGAQSEWPSHPELLDWLATEFIGSGWNVKHLHRLIVTSAAYQQSSHVSSELAQRDPENRLLARGPRFRVDAEVVRDSVLYASGLLIERLGGRSVKPYQPDGVWEAVAFIGSNTREYKQEHGDALYRRSLYTFWKRTCPPPTLLAFDAPSRETCTVRRARTNTPLQALTLMNDVQYVEAARKLAERTIAEGGATPPERAAYAFRLLNARAPQPDELEALVKTYAAQLADYQLDQPAAQALLAVGESKRNEALDPVDLAAWTMVANLIINLDESITKE